MISINKTIEQTGVLEQTIRPFEIGKIKSTVSELKEITHDEVQKKYNQFATILRKYNVGGRENAFDKLVNLFFSKKLLMKSKIVMT